MNPSLILRRIEYFVAVAEELHFGRAAERLHIAQPPLSQQIRKLEADLGLKLFERTTRSVELTEEGRTLYPEALRLLRSAASLRRTVEQVKVGQRGLLRIGFVDSAAYELVPRFLHDYRELWPDVELELRHMSSDEQLDALVAGDLDLGVGRAHGDPTLIRTHVLAEEPLVLAVHSSHRLASAERVKLGDLASERMIGFDRTRSGSLHEELTAMVGRHGVRYSPAVEATEYTTILGLVAAGEGVAIVPSGVRTFRPPGLKYLKIADSDAYVRLVVLSRVNDNSILVSNAFETITESLARIIEDAQPGTTTDASSLSVRVR